MAKEIEPWGFLMNGEIYGNKFLVLWFLFKYIGSIVG